MMDKLVVGLLSLFVVIAAIPIIRLPRWELQKLTDKFEVEI